MRDVAIIGAGMIPFGRRDEDTLMDMLAYASLKALDDAGLGDKTVDAVYVGNMGGGMLQHQIGDRQLAGRPAEPAAGGRRDDRERPGFGRLGGQERPAGGGLRLLRHGAGGRRREDARGHRLAGHRFRRHHDPPAGRIPLRHHPARHGGHVHPPVHGKIRRDARACWWRSRSRTRRWARCNPYAHVEMALDQGGHLRQPARHRQQPGRRPTRCTCTTLAR